MACPRRHRPAETADDLELDGPTAGRTVPCGHLVLRVHCVPPAPLRPVPPPPTAPAGTPSLLPRPAGPPTLLSTQTTVSTVTRRRPHRMRPSAEDT